MISRTVRWAGLPLVMTTSAPPLVVPAYSEPYEYRLWSAFSSAARDRAALWITSSQYSRLEIPKMDEKTETDVNPLFQGQVLK